MGVDLFANGALTTVTSGGTTASTGDNSFVVSNPAAFPTVSSSATPPTQFRVVDPNAPSEVMIVTNLSGTGGNTWAVTRGAEGTTPVAHAANWTAEQVITAGSLQALLAQVGDTIGTLATRPTATGSGVRYFATDDTGGTESVDTAAGTWTNTSKRGLLASSSITAPSTSLTTSQATVTTTGSATLSLSFTFGARPVKVSFSGVVQASATSTVVTVQIFNGSSVITQRLVRPAYATQDTPCDMSTVITGTAGTSLTITVQAAATAAGIVNASATMPATLIAEEI